MNLRLALILAAILAGLGVIGALYVQTERLAATERQLQETRADLAAAEASAANLRSRAETDAEVMSLPEAEMRKELSRWVR